MSDEELLKLIEDPATDKTAAVLAAELLSARRRALMASQAVEGAIGGITEMLPQAVVLLQMWDRTAVAFRTPKQEAEALRRSTRKFLDEERATR